MLRSFKKVKSLQKAYLGSSLRAGFSEAEIGDDSILIPEEILDEELPTKKKFDPSLKSKREQRRPQKNYNLNEYAFRESDQVLTTIKNQGVFTALVNKLDPSQNIDAVFSSSQLNQKYIELFENTSLQSEGRIRFRGLVNKLIKNQEPISDVTQFLELAKIAQDVSTDANLAIQPLIYDREITSLVENKLSIPQVFEEIIGNHIHNLCVFGQFQKSTGIAIIKSLASKNQESLHLVNFLNLIKKSGRMSPEEKIDEGTLKSAWNYVTKVEAESSDINSALVWYTIQNFAQEMRIKDYQPSTSEFESILSNLFVRDSANPANYITGSDLIKILDRYGQWTRDVLLTYLQQSFLGSRNYTQGLYDIVLNLALLEEINLQRDNQEINLAGILSILKESSTNSYEFNQLNLGSLFSYIQLEKLTEKVQDNFKKVESSSTNIPKSLPFSRIANLLVKNQNGLQISYKNTFILALTNFLKNDSTNDLKTLAAQMSTQDNFRQALKQVLKDSNEEDLTVLVRKFSNQKMKFDFDHYLLTQKKSLSDSRRHLVRAFSTQDKNKADSEENEYINTTYIDDLISSDMITNLQDIITLDTELTQKLTPQSTINIVKDEYLASFNKLNDVLSSLSSSSSSAIHQQAKQIIQQHVGELSSFLQSYIHSVEGSDSYGPVALIHYLFNSSAASAKLEGKKYSTLQIPAGIEDKTSIDYSTYLIQGDFLDEDIGEQIYYKLFKYQNTRNYKRREFKRLIAHYMIHSKQMHTSVLNLVCEICRENKLQNVLTDFVILARLNLLQISVDQYKSIFDVLLGFKNFDTIYLFPFLQQILVISEDQNASKSFEGSNPKEIQGKLNTCYPSIAFFEPYFKRIVRAQQDNTKFLFIFDRLTTMIRNHSFRSNKGLSDSANSVRLEAFKLEKASVIRRQYMDFVSFLMDVKIYEDARKVFNSLLAFKEIELQSKEWILGLESTVLTNQIDESLAVYKEWMQSIKFSKPEPSASEEESLKKESEAPQTAIATNDLEKILGILMNSQEPQVVQLLDILLEDHVYSGAVKLNDNIVIFTRKILGKFQQYQSFNKFLRYVAANKNFNLKYRTKISLFDTIKECTDEKLRVNMFDVVNREILSKTQADYQQVLQV